ncbi:CDP-diacylglycerol--serine O-phosphatidyltransferase [Exiguobacterium sp. s46]|uniref:CDP-diacylglycerol--serine O-phosphatidyltransferase n=1 Tax=Exiguobacterium sp. s46 TaxID=2751200 RepID=UPI001BE6A0F6|nr:CDP-diacylglycerol--serine O-phosphatidyltransferase [Exiguobacterium sp. s46]
MPKSAIPVILTISNFVCGTLSIFAVLEENFSAAIGFILFGLLFDLFDGRIARKLGTVSEFGKELDSFSDLVTFGIAPALFTYHVLLSDFGQIGLFLAVSYNVCALLRLARFNTTQSELPTFIGLPVPAAAVSLLISTIFLSPMFVAVIMCLLSYLMISHVKIPHAKKISTEKEQTI